jgi:hypothetical protein
MIGARRYFRIDLSGFSSVAAAFPWLPYQNYIDMTLLALMIQSTLLDDTF